MLRSRAMGCPARTISFGPTSTDSIKPAAGAALPGGNAHAFDWPLLQGWAAPVPWLLAGGLTPRNVAEAIKLSGAAAVDVSSSVERERGVKDAGLIRSFVQAAKQAPGA